jgi:hypothetical protein
MFDHQQIIIPINDEEDLSIVSMQGVVEIAVRGPEGVYHNTVIRISKEKDLRDFMKKWFGE